MTDKTLPFSVLDLAPIPQGSSAREAFSHSLDLAQLAEKRGYHRYWLAEHHNMVGIASAATSVLIGYLAANTTTLHLGSGGVMLPNHAPLVIAEQFGTLESLYPGRIDLGLGRAPGTDQRTARALRRDLAGSAERFPQDVQELMMWFAPATPEQAIRAVPGAGLNVPIWLLGSSLFSAELAGHLGLPFSFASHFAPRLLMHALDRYRELFRPSPALAEPYAMVALNAIAADTRAEAELLFNSLRHRFTAMARGQIGQLTPPGDFDATEWTPAELAFADQSLSVSAVGTADEVCEQLRRIQQETGAQELMLTAQIHDAQLRERSFASIAKAWGLDATGD